MDIPFINSYALVPVDQLLKSIRVLEEARDTVSALEFFKVLYDLSMVQAIKELVVHTKKYNPACMIVVGIGGSNLGSRAVYEALYGSEGNVHLPLYFADTVDSDRIYALLQRAAHDLENKKTILITVISKSGTTIETVANFECFLQLLKQYHPHNYHEFVIAISDKNSKLWNLAGDQKFHQLSIPPMIGGRYSVFTAVGLFPLLLSEVDIDELLRGAQNSNFMNAAMSASIIAYHYKNGKNIHDLFKFDTTFESMGKWYRQLMGESLGKDGKGITPIISMGSTDLHSVGQLYLGGPRDKITTFLYVDHQQHEITVPNFSEYDALVPHVQGKPLAMIMQAIFKGVQQAYAEHKIPFMAYEFPKKSAFYIGQFLQTKMTEMVMLGHLLKVNPFDQPQVELYKTQTRKILANE